MGDVHERRVEPDHAGRRAREVDAIPAILSRRDVLPAEGDGCSRNRLARSTIADRSIPADTRSRTNEEITAIGLSGHPGNSGPRIVDPGLVYPSRRVQHIGAIRA